MSTFDYTNTYWNNNGQLQKHVAELEQLMPPVGAASSLKGEIFRAASKIYYDFYNNGFGNDWRKPALFLMDNVALSYEVEDFLYAHGDGICYEDTQANIELIEAMMTATIETLTNPEFVDSAAVDMWNYAHNDWRLERFAEETWEEEEDDCY